MDYEQQKKLYLEKTERLDNLLEAVEPYAFYREIFPIGAFQPKGCYEDERGNGIGLAIGSDADGDRRVTHYIVTDELDELKELQQAEFALMSPVSYYGRRRIGKNARYLYAVVFDLDGVEMPQLRDVFYQMHKDVIPTATFVVNSGTGLHLYYVLTEPVPMYPYNQKCLKDMKYALIRRIWNNYTSTIKSPQMQGVLQGFRVVGSPSKLGRDFPVRAYRLGGAVDLDSLMNYVPDSEMVGQSIKKIMLKGRLPLDKAKEMYPDWYERRIVRKEKRPHWTVKRALYDWWKKEIYLKISVGHRYFGIMTLAIYAAKCGISEEELRRDAMQLLEPYDSISNDESNRFTVEDIVCALEMYNESYVTFPRDDIEKVTGIRMPVNKRNGRKQADHLEIARAIRDITVKQQGKKSWREGNGRPLGSGTAQSIVLEWRRQNPEGRKVDCIRETGLSKPTVLKWWNI